MAETIQEITVSFEDEGQTIVEELDKVVLTKGVWSTILFRYRERNKNTGEFAPPKATLRRFQKHGGIYKKRDSVNLTAESARSLIAVLKEWLDTGLLK
ncbi:MAG: hypothetical protein LBE49_09735 [Deltaproteobacteria bacterium]|nr:hypothetical protein [Deltaproteobacteria bacterium]